MIFYSLGCQSQEMREGGIVSRGATIEPKVTFGSQSHHRTRQEFNRPSIESGCRKISVHRNKLPQRQGCAITQPDGLGYVNCWAFGPKSKNKSNLKCYPIGLVVTILAERSGLNRVGVQCPDDFLLMMVRWGFSRCTRNR